MWPCPKYQEMIKLLYSLILFAIIIYQVNLPLADKLLGGLQISAIQGSDGSL